MFEHEDTSNDSAPSNPRAGDTPGFGTGGGGSVGGGGGYGQDAGGGIARGDGGHNDYMDQGRGSNVTSNQPQSPADSIRYGMAPPVQPPVAPVALPSFAQYQMSPNMVGMPSILAGVQPPPMQITPTTEAMRPTGYIMPDMGVHLNQYDVSPTMGVETGPQRRGVPMSAVRDNFEYTNRPVLNNFLDKTRVVESSNNPNAQSTTSSAGGLYQFIDKTWLNTVQKNRPDLFNAYTEKQILDMKYDPILSTEMARDLAIDNAMALKANGLPVTEQNLYLEHFLGSGAAIKALKSDPETPITDIVSPDASRVNKILGADKTVNDVLNWTGSQMNRPSYASATTSNPFQESGAPFTGKTYTYDTMPKGPLLAGESDQAVAEAAARAAAQGGQQTAAQAASSSPETFSAWLGNLFNTDARIKQLEAQGRTSTYPGENADDVKQKYADEYANHDVSKVQSRIVDFGEGPVVDYYVKDLGTALSEGVSSSIKAVGDLFNPKSPTTNAADSNDAAKAAAQNPNDFGAWLSGIFTGNGISSLPPSRGYGPYGDMTLAEYRQTYGR
jgi:hypothetical protein